MNHYIKHIAFFILSMTAPIGILAQESYIVEPFAFNYARNNEIFAVSYQDGVIFCSDRRTNVLVNRMDTTRNPLYNLFFAHKKSEDKWDNVNVFSNKMPVDAHQISCTFSADGREMFFGAFDETGQRIYTARKTGNEWSNIQPFVHSKPNIVTTHPSLSYDGRWLFFASNMPGGYGGFDIYVSERTSRGWGQPVNLGPEINTPGNELYPFIHQTGELFFSSSEHGSMGGLDIFSARQTGDNWGSVQQLEPPINSPNDDIAYTSDIDGVNGFFASNRTGQKFNIYSFQSLFPVFKDCSEQEENDYTYIFSEGIGEENEETLKLMWDLGDGTIEYGEEIEHTYAAPGEYMVILNVIDIITNEITEDVASFPFFVEDIEQPYITAVESANVGTVISFDASKTNLPDMDIKEYYWIFGDGTRQSGMKATHVYVEPGVYNVVLGVSGKMKYDESGANVKICVTKEIIIQ